MFSLCGFFSPLVGFSVVCLLHCCWSQLDKYQSNHILPVLNILPWYSLAIKILLIQNPSWCFLLPLYSHLPKVTCILIVIHYAAVPQIDKAIFHGCRESLQDVFLPSVEIIVLYSLHCLFCYVLHSLSKFLNNTMAFLFKNKSCLVRMNNYFKAFLNSINVPYWMFFCTCVYKAAGQRVSSLLFCCYFWILVSK